jgi:hypothetical protein
MRVSIALLILVLVVSCGKRNHSGDSEVFLEAKPLGQLTDKKLEEVSGLAASKANPGYLWTHNDSGNPPEVYLVDEKLKIRLSCNLPGIKNRDWEDIAVGPGPTDSKTYVYVADIGDNNAKHKVKYIYRFEEPVANAKGEMTIESFDRITFRLEDGPKDTEAIMVDPKTKNIYVVSKREKPVSVYEIKYPYAVNETVTAAKIVALPLTQIVSADISSDGNEVLMKNYDNIYYWKIDGQPIAEVLHRKPQLLKYTEEPQGEAITFDLNGAGFYTLSETLLTEKIFLYYYERKKR